LILLDTNIFLEYLLDRKDAKDCGRLLTKLSRGEVEGVVTRYSLHSIETVYKSRLLAGFLANLDRSLGLSVRDTTTAEEVEVANISRTIGLDFDDTMQYYVAKKLGVDRIVTFDHHFEGLDIPRAEPKDLA
jgi:predicted nucleic acid-binding protein